MTFFLELIAFLNNATWVIYSSKPLPIFGFRIHVYFKSHPNSEMTELNFKQNFLFGL